MIKLKTDCETCMHKNICRFRDNAKSDVNKLKNINYGIGPNDNYDWDTISNSRHVTIEFSCMDYTRDNSIATLNPIKR